MSFGGLPGPWVSTNDLGSFVLKEFDLSSALAAGTITNATGASWLMTGPNAVINLSGDSPWILGSGGNGMSLASTLTINGSGLANLTINAAISGGGGLVINANGISPYGQYLTLSGTNTFSGGVVLNSGGIYLGSSSALGTGPITINGGGVLGGATISNPVQFNSPLTGSYSCSFTGSVSQGASPVGINVFDSQLTFQGQTVLTGNVSINRSSLELRSLARLAAPSVDVSLSTLSLNNTGTDNADRIPDASPVSMRASNLFIGAPPTAPNVETLGAVSWSGPSNFAATGPVTLTLASLQRNGRGLLLAEGATLGTTGATGEQILAPNLAADLVGGGGAAGSTTISILPYVLASPHTHTGDNVGFYSFATYGANGIRPLTAGEFSASFGSTTSNVKPGNTSIVLNQDVTANALITQMDVLHTISGPGTIHLTSGLFLDQRDTAISSKIAFGGTEAVLAGGFGGTDYTSQLLGDLTGTNGLTLFGKENFGGNNTGLTGSLTLCGMCGFSSDVNLPGTGPITSSGQYSGLAYFGSNPETITRDIVADSGWLTLYSKRLNDFEISSNISGPGAVLIDGYPYNGALTRLSGNNTFTGPIQVRQSDLRVTSDTALGNGPYLFLDNGGTLTLEGDWTTQKTLIAPYFAVVNTNGHNAAVPLLATFNGDPGYNFQKIGPGSLQINTVTPDSMGTVKVIEGSMTANGPAHANLVVGDTATVASFSGAISLNDLILGSKGTLSPGSNGPGTLQTNTWTWRGNGDVNFDLGPTSDLIVVTDKLTRWANILRWRFNFNALPGLTTGTYPLIKFGRLDTGGGLFSVSDFSFTGPSGFDGHFVMTANQLQFVVTSVPGLQVSGTVNLQNFSISPAGMQVVVEIRAPGTTTPLDSRLVTLDATGNFSFSSSVAVGTYDIAVKGSHWLRRVIGNQTITNSGISGLSFSLFNGDVNGDNVVSLGDLGQLRAAFSSTSGDGNWNPAADLNGDGAVSLADLGILRTNFSRQGDP